MPRIKLPGATLRFPAADQETAEELARLFPTVKSILENDWGLKVPADVRIHVVDSWFKWNIQGTPWSFQLLFLYLLPSQWYLFSRRGQWQTAYVQGFGVGTNWVMINAKSLRQLPSGDRPQWLATWDIFEKDFSYRDIWDFRFAGSITSICLGIRTPRWLEQGIAQAVARQSLQRPWAKPKDWRPIWRLAGEAMPRVPSANANDYTQDEMDDLCARDAWAYWTTLYLKEKHPDVLRDVLRLKALAAEDAHALLSKRLDISPDGFWHELVGRAINHFGGEIETASGQPVSATLVAADDDDNPYRAPATAIGPTRIRFKAAVPLSRRARWLLVFAAIIGLVLGISLLRPLGWFRTASGWIGAGFAGLAAGWIVYALLMAVVRWIGRAWRGQPAGSERAERPAGHRATIFRIWHWALSIAFSTCGLR